MFFSFRKVKGRGGHLLPDDYVWPAHSCPDLLELVAVWLRFRSLCSALPRDSPHMWRLPWESRKFSKTRLTKIFAEVVDSLGLKPPKGRYWTLHCVRAGSATAAYALKIPIPKIRACGGWGRRSQVPEDRYIDFKCPACDDGRRFFGWLTD